MKIVDFGRTAGDERAVCTKDAGPACASCCPQARRTRARPDPRSGQQTAFRSAPSAGLSRLHPHLLDKKNRLSRHAGKDGSSLFKELWSDGRSAMLPRRSAQAQGTAPCSRRGRRMFSAKMQATPRLSHRQRRSAFAPYAPPQASSSARSTQSREDTSICPGALALFAAPKVAALPKLCPHTRLTTPSGPMLMVTTG